jgi:arabinose-5-phosphate isomerase
MEQSVIQKFSTPETAPIFIFASLLSSYPDERVAENVGIITGDSALFSGASQALQPILLPLVRKIGAKIVGMTGNLGSPLAKHSDVVIDVSVKKEACPMNLAPTTSTTAMLAMGDALAIALLEAKGFKEKDFAFYHPAGSLGKKLLLVSDIMRQRESNPIVREKTALRTVLYAITKARAGSATVVNAKGELVGIFTDGDLRRGLEKDPSALARPVKDVMTKSPKHTTENAFAMEALKILRDLKIGELPVLNEAGAPVGVLSVKDLISIGLL